MNFWNHFQKNTTRQERVDLMIAMLVKYQKFTWEGAWHRLRDAVDKYTWSILISAGVVSGILFIRLQLISSAFDLLGIIPLFLIPIFLITITRKKVPDFGLTTLMVGLSAIIGTLFLAMIMLPQFFVFIAGAGIVGTALTISVGLHWLVHFIQINLPDIHDHEF